MLKWAFEEWSHTHRLQNKETCHRINTDLRVKPGCAFLAKNFDQNRQASAGQLIGGHLWFKRCLMFKRHLALLKEPWIHNVPENSSGEGPVIHPWAEAELGYDQWPKSKIEFTFEWLKINKMKALEWPRKGLLPLETLWQYLKWAVDAQKPPN